MSENCGCQIFLNGSPGRGSYFEIHRCPLHAAAPRLLACLTNLVRKAREDDHLDSALMEAEAAIAAVKPVQE